jgi:hypothetical protein
MSDLMPVPFHNATLYLADVDGTPYAPMKPIVEGMGLDWSTQLTKLNANKARWSMAMIATVAEDGKTRETVCLPLRKLPGWLMTVNPRKVDPDIRVKIEAYQAECDDVLWDYWTKGQAINPRAAVLPDFTNPAEAARAWAHQYDGRIAAERQVALDKPKRDFYDQVIRTDRLLDFAEAFSLLHGRTGQNFTFMTFLAFLRRHGVAKKENPYSGIGPRRFVPCDRYRDAWFVFEVNEYQAGSGEWKIRLLAIDGIIRLIEAERAARGPGRT